MMYSQQKLQMEALVTIIIYTIVSGHVTIAIVIYTCLRKKGGKKKQEGANDRKGGYLKNVVVLTVV